MYFCLPSAFSKAPTSLREPLRRTLLLPLNFTQCKTPSKIAGQAAWHRMENGPTFAILVAWYRPHFAPPARNGKKMAEKWILAPPGKWPKNGRKMGKLPFLTHFLANFPIFRPFFSHFPGGAKIHFSAIFVKITQSFLRRVFQVGVVQKSLGSHVVVVCPCMVVGDCCHVGPDDCHHRCRC